MSLTVKGKNGDLRNSKDPIIKGQAKLNYNLQTGDSLWEMTVTDLKESVQLKYRLPLKVPEMIEMTAARQIFFNDNGTTPLSFVAVIDIALDQGSRKGVQVEVQLCPGKSILHRKTLELTDDALDLHLPLSGFSSGCYTIEARLLENGKEIAMTSLPIIIVPNYASVE